jgi:hypothetical protein
MSAETIEVVVNTNPIHSEDLNPDLRYRLLRRVTRIYKAFNEFESGLVRAGSALLSTFPSGVSGRASSPTKPEGTMYSGSLSFR